MPRAVLSPVVLDTGDVTYEVPAGWTIATLLPLLNTSVAPGLQKWDPDRWTRHRLTDEKSLPSPMLVTAFGHGRHSCPAQPFSLSAMTATMTRLFDRYRMTPGWTTHPRPVPAQIGGVARADEPCTVSYVEA
jgi:cytochrome P450